MDESFSSLDAQTRIRMQELLLDVWSEYRMTIDKLLGTKEWFVIHHTDCGMALFTDSIIRELLRSSLETAEVGSEGWKDIGQGPGSDAGDFINWLTFADETSSVIADVSRIRKHPLVPRTIPVYGYVYDVRSGKLIEVPKATEIGAAQA